MGSSRFLDPPTFLVGVLLVAISYCGIGHAAEGMTTSASLGNLTARFWQWRLKNSPEYGTKYGIRSRDDQLEQFTEDAMRQQVDEAKQFLLEANALSGGDLNEQEGITLEVLKNLLSTFIRGYAYRSYGSYIGVGVFDNPLTEIKTTISWMKFNTEHDYTMALRRYREFPEYIKQKITLLHIAIQNETVRSIASVDAAIKAFTDFNSTSPLQDTFFYEPFKNMVGIPSADSLQSEALEIIHDDIMPAVQEYTNFLIKEYRPKARTIGGVGSLPGGRKFYRECLYWHLSLDHTPQEIHNLGIQEVKRISEQIKQVMLAANFHGDVRSYLAFLKNDSQNMFTTEEQMLQAFKDTVDKIHTHIPTILDRPPRLNITIQRAASANAPTGRYTEPALDGSRDGIFYANIYEPQTRPRFALMALTLHEVEPGHHTQMSYVIKENIPDFRRAVEYRKYYAIPFNWPFYTAYVEGWALYAESLGEEMGLFSTNPKSMLGRYTSEILRACRLVVDTGIHEFGWNASRAEDYLLKYTDLPEGQIKVEVKRYASYPGQATAYKIGELTIKRLRKEAKDKLGSSFDLRAFHRTILRLGPVPLSIMERVVRKWVDGEVAIASAVTSGSSSRVAIGGVTLVTWLVNGIMLTIYTVN